MRNIINYKRNTNPIKSEDGVYSIACMNCDINCIGETSKSIKKPIY